MERAPHPVVVAVAGAVLVWHAAAGPHLFDAGELVAAAWQLGGSHPPGQPLHAIVGHAFAWIPLGPIPFRVALVSVVGEIFAAYVIARIVAEAIDRGATAEAPVPVWLRVLAPHAAFTAMLLAPPMLRQALRVEVYGLALALVAVAAWMLARWAAGGGGASGALRVAALCAGLAAAVHPPHALAALLAGVAALAMARRDVLRQPRALAWAAAACVMGLVGYVYLPIRASAGAPMWGDPSTLAGFGEYVTGSAYARNLGSSGGSVVDTIVYIALAAGVVSVGGVIAGVVWGRKAGGGSVAVAVAGAGAVAGSVAAAGVLGGGAVLAGVAAFLQPLETGNPDNVAYAGPAVALWIAAGAIGFAVLVRLPGVLARGLGAVGLVVLGVSPVFVRDVPATLAADLPALETFGGALVDAPPPRALVLTTTDYPGATWWMAQSVDGARPDVAWMATGLATSSWHWRSLAPHPAFDGTPRRGRGTDASAAYVEGAVRTAWPSVAVLSELDAPVNGRGRIDGPYLRIPPPPPGGASADAEPAEGPRTRLYGERLEPVLARDARRSPPGDSGAAAAILRHHQILRAHRLLARRRITEALEALTAALHDRPATERALLDVSIPRGTAPRATIPVVRDPEAFLASAGDAVREASVMLVAAGAPDRAIALLAARADEADARDGLQLAWIHLATGDLPRARQAVETTLSVAPALRTEAAALLSRVGG